MKHVALVRDRVLARVVDMLEHLRIQVSCYTPDELEILRTLERPRQYAVAEDVARYVMEKLGAPAASPAEARFDKTHRALVKKRGRPPRGEKFAGPPTASDALVPHE